MMMMGAADQGESRGHGFLFGYGPTSVASRCTVICGTVALYLEPQARVYSWLAGLATVVLEEHH
jgi:hypothetical protein